MFIYLITNLKNSKKYIGQTIRTIKERWQEHLADARNPKRKKYAIHKAILKHKEENFKIEVQDSANSIDELNMLEEFWIDFYQCRNKKFGYNIRFGGNNSATSEETKEKQRIASKGNTWNKGRKHTEESKKNMSLGHIGNTARLGIPHTKECLEKMLEKRLNLPPHGDKKWKGIYFNKKNGKFNAKIKVNGKSKHLGTFITEESAAQAYNNAVDEYRNGVGYKNDINIILVKEDGRKNIAPKNNKKFKGVYLDKRRSTYWAKIKVKGKNKFLGTFITEIEAAQAYNDAVDLYRDGKGYKNIIPVN